MDFALSYTPLTPTPTPVPITLPGSKSITARALIINALAPTPAPIRGLAQCDDTYAIQDALRSHPLGTIDIGAAGTAMRFLTALFAATPSASLLLTGSQRMTLRPIEPLVNALQELGAQIQYRGQKGYPPIQITGRTLTGGHTAIRADISSQYISALMIIAPTLRRGLTLHLLTPLTSRPYIHMTARIMREFGIQLTITKDTIQIPPQAYLTPPHYQIEADWSAAAFIYQAMALTATPSVSLTPLLPPEKSLQGDSRIAQIFTQFGITTTYTPQATTLTYTPTPTPTTPLTLSLADTPDLTPPLVVTAALTGRPFHFTGLHTLRIKESDRIATLVSEMRALGIYLRCDSDSILWQGETCTPTPTPLIHTHNDHRIAMAFAPAVTKIPGLKIADAMVVNKSYPHYWQQLRRLGIQTQII